MYAAGESDVCKRRGMQMHDVADQDVHDLVGASSSGTRVEQMPCDHNQSLCHQYQTAYVDSFGWAFNVRFKDHTNRSCVSFGPQDRVTSGHASTQFVGN